MEGGGRACRRWLGVGRRERAPQADPVSGAAGGHVESSKSVSIQAAGSRDRLTHHDRPTHTHAHSRGLHPHPRQPTRSSVINAAVKCVWHRAPGGG